MEPIFKWHLEALFTRPEGWDQNPPEEAPPLAFWRNQGIGPFLHEQRLNLPPAWDQALQAMAQAAAISEGLSFSILQETLAQFRAANLRLLLVKGAALAQTLYPKPYTRVRCDSDLWISENDRMAAESLLIRTGWAVKPTLQGDLVRHQQIYLKTDNYGHVHQLDVHWSLFDRPALRQVFCFDSFYARGIELDRLAVRIPNWQDHLLILLLHLGGHHPNHMRLIWLLDLWLIGEKLGSDGWDRVVEQCRRAPYSAYANRPLAWLAYLSGSQPHPPQGSDPEWQRVMGDLRSLSWPKKWLYLQELACPKPAYMRQRYDPENQQALWKLYLWRWRRAAAYLLRR